MLRPTVPADTEPLVSLTAATGFFKPHEVVALREVLDDYHATNREYGHAAQTWDEGAGPVGFIYLAPTAMTDRTWELWWIAVTPDRCGGGLGGKMLAAAEDAVRAVGGRLLLIETGSTPLYEPTRGFYRKHAYVEAARIPDFYADGDDKVIFWKRISAA